MADIYPLVPSAIEEVVSADNARKLPWIRMTRTDTAVTADTTALHAPCARFDLWESVQYQAFPRRHEEAVA